MRKLAIFFLFFSYLFASTINVPSDHASIQGAIDQAQNGDTVLVQPGIYYENISLNKEIFLLSTVIEEDLYGASDWYQNDIINQTIIDGSVLSNPNKRSCLVVRDNDIQPVIKGFTFRGGVGTKMLIMDCGENGGLQRSELNGGAILIYKSYPTINYNRFIGNGVTPDSERARKGSKNGGAIAHYESSEVEFDEDRSQAMTSQSNNSTREIPPVMNIQNNYFEGNASGNGEGFYSLGYNGQIDVSHSVFENVDCETNTVNDYILNSSEDLASYVQDDISGICINENMFYVSTMGSDNNSGTETSPFGTISHALSFVKTSGSPTTIHVAAGTYSPSQTKEIFPIVLPNNVHLIGEDRNTTILDAQADAANEAAVIIIKEVETVTLKNFTLTNGYSEGHGCIGGGGLLVTNDNMFDITVPPAVSTPVIENLILEDNWSHNGGGISLYLVDGPSLTNIIVKDNEATFHGGGIFIFVSNVTIDNLEVRGNRNWGNPDLFMLGNGGGIMSVASGAIISNLTLIDNIGKTMGGGLFHMGNSQLNAESFSGFVIDGATVSGNEAYYGGGMSFFDGADPLIKNSEISYNFSEDAGGGIHMDASSPEIVDCLISDNFAYEGGGVFAYNESSPTIKRCIIRTNEVQEEGGGIYLKDALRGTFEKLQIFDNVSESYSGGISIFSSIADIINCTISNNVANLGDGGIGAWGGLGGSSSNLQNANIINSIVWGNLPNDLGVWDNSDVSIAYSNVPDFGGTNGNFVVNPLFTDASNGDYGLQVNSFCIDAGTADVSSYFNHLDNIENFHGSAPDVGAIELDVSIQSPQNIDVDVFEQQFLLRLVWDPVSASTGYRIEKSNFSDFSNIIEDFTVTAPLFLDSGLEPDIEYFYRIFTLINDNESDASETITVLISTMSNSNLTELIPDNYDLKQNYPNPFNPSTLIKYSLPESRFVNVSVYDMMGRNIKTLVNSVQAAGYKSVSWNATDNEGNILPAGMYIYSIIAGDFKSNRKMVLLK